MAVEASYQVFNVLARDSAQGLGRVAQPLVKIRAHRVLNGVLVLQVINLNDSFLAVAVNAAHPLLITHGVPGQVIVNQDVTELKIDTFAASLRRNQETHFRFLPEQPLASSLAVRFRGLALQFHIAVD